jgi:DMSO/TMAO reductase YedYZ molybdopterin-dependent catalytic subunit
VREDGVVNLPDPSQAASGDAAPNRTSPYLVGAGVLTGLAGLVTSQAAVWFLGANNGPIVAVASAVRDFTPGPLAHALIKGVGKQDTTLLRIGTFTLLMLIFAWIGSQARKRPWVPDIGYFLLAAFGLLCVLRLPDSNTGSTLGIVVGLITWLVVDRLLTVPLADIVSSTPGNGRRAFLLRATGIVALTGLVGISSFLPQRRRGQVNRERQQLRLAASPGTPPNGSTLGVDGVSPWQTPLTAGAVNAGPDGDGFYQIATTLSSPVLAESDWKLRIHGMVDKEITINYQDLIARQFTQDWITLCCVSNPVGGNLIGNAYWSGVPVRELLAEAGIKPGADAVLQTSVDGWTCGTPIAAVTDQRSALLAVAMNGNPLPVEHGYPVRMVVPGLYGYVSATKWLVDIEVTRFDRFNAYWTQRGWSAEGPVKTQSRIDVPIQGAQTSAGALRIGGVAWAQHTGIKRVEYQLDGAAWQSAELGTATPTDDTWVQWAGSVQVAAGNHTLVVRATDKSGYTQTSVVTDTIPNGASGWHQVDFSAG